jgi:hypothetical protein
MFFPAGTRHGRSRPRGTADTGRAKGYPICCVKLLFNPNESRDIRAGLG